MAPASEKVDERILRLLGLDFVGDIDYGTYITLINEAILTGRNRLPQEELALLSNEKKRVRGKQGRFKPQKQKITADKFAITKFLKPVVQPISSPLLPSQVQTPQVQGVNLTPLQEPLESIKNTLNQFLKFRKNSDEQERRGYEAQKRSKREALLEGSKKGMAAVSNAVKSFVSPFQNILDRILRFIFFTLLGRAFSELINWFSDQKNTKKVETLKRFFKNWWPTILGAAVLFFTPLGRFIRVVLRIVGGLTGRLVAQIPKIGSAINALRLVVLRNPLLAGLAIGGAAIAGAAVAISNQQQRKESEDQEVSNAEQQVQQFSSGGSILKSLFGVGQVNPHAQLFGYGGITNDTGQRISGFGPDTQLIAAQPGEIVINKRTVDAVGSDTFLNLNRYYGGPNANKPKLGRLFNTGGKVGDQSGEKSSLLNSRALQIFNRLRSRGLSPTAAMGIVANIGVETGYTYSPSTVEQGGGPGRGIVQWKSGGRFDTDNINLQSFAKSRNRSWNDLNTQVDFIVHELNTHPEFKPLKKDLNSSKSTQEATQLFLTRYEKAGVGHLDRRFAVGQELEQKINSSAVAKPKPEEKRPWYDPLGWFGGAAAVKKKKDGGSFGITKNTGFDIPPWAFPGAGIDSQFVPLALQKGEHGMILTKKAVESGAVPAFEDLLTKFDPNSNSAKDFNYNSDPKIPEIKPLSAQNSGITYLPDINQSSGGSSASGQGGGSQVPPFSAISPKSMRSVQLTIYDIRSA